MIFVKYFSTSYLGVYACTNVRATA